MGLTRAFMYAGTPAVSVTLWSVESQSAKELNVGMYQHLSRKLGRAEALREIKLALLRGDKGEQYRHPFFWAPLVMFGDGR
jgi:CHAT domain-containing protein